MMKKLLVAALLGSILLTSGCGSLRRAGKDLLVTAFSPGIVLYGAGTDGAVDAKNVQVGIDAGDAVQVFAFPFAFAYRVVDHTLSCAVHALDFAAFPFYAIAELHPDSNIQPLQIYKNTFFDQMGESEEKADAATGEGR
jgi:predicted small secreted protein